MACGDSGGGKKSLSGLGIDDGFSDGVATSKLIDGSKDERLELDTGAVLEVSAGAVSKDVKITVERPADTKALKLVESFKSPGRIASAPYVLTPHGTTFKGDVTITLPIAKEGKNKDLRVAWLENEKDTQWKLLGVPKDNGEKGAAITLKHFSVLVLVEGEDDLEPMAEEDEPSEPDAGSGELDAGVDVEPRDAGMSMANDAQVRSDAGMMMPPPDAGPAASTYYSRLSECQLLERPGAIQEPMPHGPFERCYLDCWLKGSCADLRYLVCGDIDGVDASVSVAVANCVQGCAFTSVQCPDQSTALRCDGNPSCADASDEANCGDLYFQCAAPYPVLSEQRCDGYADCTMGEDELNCPHHMCDGVSLPPDVVCDGLPDCIDGSDEPATCAKLICTPPTGDRDPPLWPDAGATSTAAVVEDGGLR